MQAQIEAKGEPKSKNGGGKKEEEEMEKVVGTVRYRETPPPH